MWNHAEFKEWDDLNQDVYGQRVIRVTEDVLRLLDEKNGPILPEEVMRIVCDAAERRGVELTYFQGAKIIAAVGYYHERGKEWQQAWEKGRGPW